MLFGRGTRPCLLAAALVALVACRATPEPSATAGVVSADHPLASQAGAEMLRQGGNAVDAAVAAALAGGVVQPHSSGLGGGGFAVVVAPGQEPIAFDFREVAPAAASADMYLGDDGQVVPGASDHGGLAVAVPAESRGLAALLRRHGSLEPAVVAAPAIRMARRGFPVGDALASASRRWSDIRGKALFPGLFDGASGPPEAGSVVTRSRLALTLEAWAATGGEALHVGPLAIAMAADLQRQGGVVTAADLEGYRPLEREPLVRDHRDKTLITMPPPSSGGLVILQVLGVLEAWAPLGPALHDPAAVHRTVEALKHGFADRARWMGDPGFVEIPVERLLSDERMEEVRSAIRTTGTPGLAGDRPPGSCMTLPTEAYGLPLDPGLDEGTHHISVMDASGMAVALTTTINTSFGSGVVAHSTGVLLNDEMDDFVAAPGVPNAYGLVGNERNAVAPGKRPLSSMSPTVVLDDQGTPRMVVGASGGPRIITGTLLVLQAVLEAGLDGPSAVAAPRYHHQWLPEHVRVDPAFPEATRRALESCGHVLQGPPPGSAVQVARRLADGSFEGAGDPRKGGVPAIVP